MTSYCTLTKNKLVMLISNLVKNFIFKQYIFGNQSIYRLVYTYGFYNRDVSSLTNSNRYFRFET